MATPQDVAALFARTLDLFRDPGAKEEQKARFRTLAAMLKAEGVTITAQDGRLLVNGAAEDAGTLLRPLEFPSVKEIAGPAGPPAPAMAEQPRAPPHHTRAEASASRLRRRG